MSEIIKCPICRKMAGIRYDINRVYQSRCQNMKCRETVTVTAPSEAAAEELFSRFEKGTNQPQLTIPQSVAKQADKSSFNEMITLGAQAFYWWFDHEDDEYIPVIYAYLAGKALGVDLVKVVDE